MGAVNLELGGEPVAELVMLNEIYHINASTLITPVNQQGSGIWKLSPFTPKMPRLVYSWSALLMPNVQASSQGSCNGDGFLPKPV